MYTSVITCCENFQPTTEPMIPTNLPTRSWEKAASDLFELKVTPHIVVVDYFSCYTEVMKLTTTSAAILKAIFSRHDIPDSLTTDNGTQYALLVSFQNPITSLTRGKWRSRACSYNC